MTGLPIGLNQSLFGISYGFCYVGDKVRPQRIVQNSPLEVRRYLEIFHYLAVASSTMPVSSSVRP
jgi:hypothetical protein